MNQKQQKAFTLAEVLITLAIIGVVAALAIPTLITSYKKQETSIRLKHFYSAMSQALKLSEVDNGYVTTWKKEEPTRDEENKLIPADRVSMGKAFAEKYILPYLAYTKAETETSAWAFESNVDEDLEMFMVYLKNGSSFGVLNGSCINIYFDTNANNSPNINGKDRFFYLICTNSVIINNTTLPLGFITYGAEISTRDHAKEACENYPLYCAHLLKYDNWEFKEDYPW